MDTEAITKKLQELIYVIQGHVVCMRQLLQNLRFEDGVDMDDFDELTNVIRLDELRMSMLLLSMNNENRTGRRPDPAGLPGVAYPTMSSPMRCTCCVPAA